ncbi:MAG: hypothetical protein IJZ59_01315 [Alphaproteobacteria bacterium]|nr:hypothetical protein [Alphaproteobacteria bacterium]
MEDKEVEKVLNSLENIETAGNLSEIYSYLLNYAIDGALGLKVSEAKQKILEELMAETLSGGDRAEITQKAAALDGLEKIEAYAQKKVNEINWDNLTPEAAVEYDDCIKVLKTAEKLQDDEERDSKIAAAVLLFDKENGLDDLDENTDVTANAEAWDKQTETISPISVKEDENGNKKYVITAGFERWQGFFSSLNREEYEEIMEMARIEALQKLSKKAPGEDKNANKLAYITMLNDVLEETSNQLWGVYQQQLFIAENGNLPQVTEKDLQTAEKLVNPEAHIEAATEEEIQAAEEKIASGEELSLSEAARICKGCNKFNKPIKPEVFEVISHAGKKEKVDGDDLVALSYLIGEAERNPESKVKEEDIKASKNHLSILGTKINLFNRFREAISTAKAEFNKDTFSRKDVLKSAVASVVCIRSANIVKVAKRMAVKTKAKNIWGKIKAWDKKVTEKYPKLYPLAKQIATTATIGLTTGVAGLAIYSGVKLCQNVKKNKAQFEEKKQKALSEGKEFPYKTYGQYFRSKENRKEAVSLVASGVLTAVSVGFGADALVEQGVSAVTGLAGQISEHGLRETLSNFGQNISWSGLVDKAKNITWSDIGQTTINGAKSVAKNSRIIASTTISVTSGLVTGQITASQQRQAEQELDALLQQYGVKSLPTDKKLLKLRSANPALYAQTILQQQNIKIDQGQLKVLNSKTMQVEALRKEKNTRRWGAIAGSTIGLAIAGAFGARAEDFQNPTQSGELDAVSGADVPAANMEKAGEGIEGLTGDEDTLVSEKLRQMSGRPQVSTQENPIYAEDYNPEVATTDGIDVTNLSSEQKHDLEMLFKRYPRAATLIMEGNENPAVGDTPNGDVMKSSTLQKMFKGGEIPAEKLETMVKFAGEHFDAKGNFIGPDAQALEAEARGYTAKLGNTKNLNDANQDQLTSTERDNLSKAPSENPTGQDKGDQNDVNTNQENQASSQEGQQQEQKGAKLSQEDDSAKQTTTQENEQGNSVDQTNSELQPESVVSAENAPIEINKPGVNIKYTLMPGKNGQGFSLSYKGDVSVDQEMLNDMQSNITQGKDGMYSTANGQIKSTNYNIVSMRAINVCQNATIQKAIAEDILSSGEQLTSEQAAFLRQFDGQMDKFGIEHGIPQEKIDEAIRTAAAPVITTSAQTDEAVKTDAVAQATETSKTDMVAPSPAADNNGYSTTQSGIKYTIDTKGDIVYADMLSDEAMSKAEAEIYTSLKMQAEAGQTINKGALAFMNDYAKSHDEMLASANSPQTDNATTQSQIKTEVEQPAEVTTAAKSRVVDDVYYVPERDGQNQVYDPVGEVDTQHRIFQYRGVKGHYTFIDHGSGHPELDTGYLKNVPLRTDIRGHIRATHEWSDNASYEEYLGGAIRGNQYQVNTQLDNLFKNIEGGDVVYRDMQARIADGYEPTAVEQRWMQQFSKDVKSIGLDYVDGELTPVRSPQSLRQQWYGSNNQDHVHDVVQARTMQYNSQYNR